VTTTPVYRYQRRSQNILAWVGRNSLLLALTIIFLAPFLFIVVTALMTRNEALGSAWLPHTFKWGNFSEMFHRAPVLRWTVNTLIYSVLATAFMLLSSIPVAYALARLEWRGRRFAFLLVISAMMLPPQVTTVPLYVMWNKAHLTGTLWPLILPMLFADAFSVFLLRQFLLTIPREYGEAAKVDGCGELRTLLRVIIPMARPGIAAAALFQFFYSWNDYYGPLLYTSESSNNWTLSLGLSSFRSMHGTEWNLTMALTVLVMLPAILLFFLAQKAFVQGVTLTGVKG
jgi:multiple sugar transport system permease protein